MTAILPPLDSAPILGALNAQFVMKGTAWADRLKFIEPTASARLTLDLFIEQAGSDEVWIARLREHNIIAQGATVTEAIRSFADALRGEFALAVERGESLSSIPPASTAPSARTVSVLVTAEASRLLDMLRMSPPDIIEKAIETLVQSNTTRFADWQEMMGALIAELAR